MFGRADTRPSGPRLIINDLSRSCWVRYLPGFLDAQRASALFELLERTAPWEAERPVVAGKVYERRRRSCAFGDAGLAYGYAGMVKAAHPWLPELATLLDRLGLEAGAAFNYVLCNHYPDGAAGMGWHADDEGGLQSGAPIASLSLGAERDFVFRMGNSGPETHRILLEHGSLLVMGGQTQRYFQHRLPERQRIKVPRINLTFRCVVSDGPPRH